MEKDALFGQLLDSDFGDGKTDTKGYVLRGGYTRCAQLDAQRLAIPQRTVERRPAVGDGVQREPPAPYDTSVINGVFDRDYKRLQLDLNFRF